jgi:pimeloyl-ACP methyl ester carboxylesterase
MLNAIERASFHDRSYFRAEKVSFRDWLTPARPRTWWGPTQLRRRLDHLHRLHEITAPTLVLGSRHDVQQPVSIAIEIVEQLAEARLVVFEQSGHYPYIEEGEAFWSALFEYLNPTHYTIDRNSSSSHPVS